MLYPCFTLIFGDFPNDPFYLGYNSAGRKSLFFVFLTFRDLRELKRTWDFSRIIFDQYKGLEH